MHCNSVSLPTTEEYKSRTKQQEELLFHWPKHQQNYYAFDLTSTFLCIMSLPSPAPSPNTDQGTIRAEVESQLLKLAQDLYEMEVCAGEVNPGMEDKVPEYL